MWRSPCGLIWLGRVSARASSDFGMVTAHFAFDYSLPLWVSGRGRPVRTRPILASQDCVVRLRPLTGPRTKSKKIRWEEVFCGQLPVNLPAINVKQMTIAQRRAGAKLIAASKSVAFVHGVSRDLQRMSKDSCSSVDSFAMIRFSRLGKPAG